MIIFLILLICLLNFQEPRFAAGQDECQPTSCNVTGPIIRFPFRLKGRQPERCGYPGFDLSCNSNNNGTEFEFQFPVRASARHVVLPVSAKATVQEIDYKNQVIRISVVNGSCPPSRVPELNSSASPFEVYYGFAVSGTGRTLFNCSRKPEDIQVEGPITCLNHGGFKVYAYRSYYTVAELSFSSCVKMFNISDISEVILFGPREYSVDDTRLHWSEPFCGSCEANGKYCRLKSNGTNNETECYDIPREPVEQKKKGISKNVVIAVVVVGVFVIALAFAALFHVYSVKKRKQKNERRIERFLEDYKALRPTRYTYSDVKRITDGFKYKLGQGGYGTVFKGKLSSDVPVAVKVLNNIKGNGEEFINEVGTIGKIHHVNVVRLVGYCADGYRRALVYEFLENDSLEKYISSGNQGRTLGWEKLHKVALGIAKGIDYLHQGCNQRILHFDIKPVSI